MERVLLRRDADRMLGEDRGRAGRDDELVERLVAVVDARAAAAEIDPGDAADDHLDTVRPRVFRASRTAQDTPA